MRINELLNESEKLEEGPLANKIGTAVGKGVGTLAKGVGAVAGGIAGLGSAVKKGFSAGKATVAGGGDEEPAAAGTAPAAGGAADSSAANKSVAGAFKQGLAGNKIKTDMPAAPAGGGAAPADKPAAAPAAQPAAEPAATTEPAAAASPATAPAGGGAAPAGGAAANPAADKAGQTMYAQVKANIDKLDKKGKQRILQLLQKSVGAPAPAAAPAASKGPQGGDQPNLGFGFDGNTGMPFKSQAERDAGLAKQKADKAATTTTPPAAEPAATPAATTPPAEKPAKKARAPRVKKAAPAPEVSQAEKDADRDRLMGNFTDSVHRHKQKMVAEGLTNGTVSLFRKK